MNRRIIVTYSIISCIVFLSCIFISIQNVMNSKEEQALLENDLVLDNNKPEAIPEMDNEEETTINLNNTYIGRWKRIKMIVNSENVPFSQSIIDLQDGHFTKDTNCQISGNLTVTEDKMIMEVTKDGCEEGDYFINYYNLSSDKNDLVLIIKDSNFEVQDIYRRINN